jgi:hemerythrin
MTAEQYATKVTRTSTEALLSIRAYRSTIGLSMEADVTSVAWSHACVVGVKAMDDQHGILMDTLNELHLQLVRGTGHDKLHEHIERLVEFTGLHFGCEESLLERYGFPGLEEHRAAHQRLMSEIRHAADRVEHGRESEFQRLLSFLSSSYLQHIEALDRQYGAWLNARGIY